MTLTPDHPMRLPHLLGADWETVHWFDSEVDRDRAFGDMSTRLPNYREGDDPRQVLTKIER